MSYILETIAFNIESCLLAQAAGANRIELCDNPTEGGTTPSYGFIKAARKVLNIDLFPIIRPRGGDFLYSDEAFEIMKTDVKICKELQCDGVVIGMLNANASIDKIKCAQLVTLAYPMSVTFHRAFDRVLDAHQSLEDVIEIGCERILTSGFYPNVIDGIENIKKLIAQADDRIVIMPGSGVRANNIVEIIHQTGAKEIHSSARKNVHSSMVELSKTMNENLQSVLLDEDEIKKMVENMNTI